MSKNYFKVIIKWLSEVERYDLPVARDVVKKLYLKNVQKLCKSGYTKDKSKAILERIFRLACKQKGMDSEVKLIKFIDYWIGFEIKKLNIK